MSGGAPPSVIPGSRLRRGAQVGGAQLEELILRGERIHCWRGRRSDGVPVTVHALVDEATQREADNFLRAARRLASVTGATPMVGVVEVAAVLPTERLYLALGSAAGTMEDISLLGWGTREIVTFARKLCRAVRELHRHGILHGCLRPGNVLLDDDLDPRLSNVGAVILDDSYPTLPSDGTTDYHPYAAREVRLGEVANPQADVFSLGRLLHFALLNETPDEPDEDLPRLDALEYEAPGLVRIIRKCCARDREARYPSVDAMLSDLDRYDRADYVGLQHPEGREGDDRISGPPSWQGIDPPEEERPSRTSWVPGQLPRRDRPTPRQEAPPSSQRQGPPSSRSSVSERPAAPHPRPVARPAVVRIEEEEDVLSPAQARVGAVLGALIVVGALGVAYFTSSPALPLQLGVLFGAVVASLIVPTFGDAPWPSRVSAAVVFGLTAWFIDPVPTVSHEGLQAKLSAVGPAARGQRLAQLRASGFLDFVRLDLRGTDLSGLDLRGVRFDESNLRAALFGAARLEGASFTGADIAGADFSGAELTGADLTTAVGWNEVICDDATVMPPRWTCVDGGPRSSALIPVEDEL